MPWRLCRRRPIPAGSGGLRRRHQAQSNAPSTLHLILGFDLHFLSCSDCAHPIPGLGFRQQLDVVELPFPYCSAVAGVELVSVLLWYGVVLASPVVLLLWPHGHCPVAVELRPWA